MNAPHRYNVLALPLCLALAACGGGSDSPSTPAAQEPDQTPDQTPAQTPDQTPAQTPDQTPVTPAAGGGFTRVGTVSLDDDVQDGLSVSGGFFRLAAPLAADPFAAAVAPTPGNECEITTTAEFDADIGDLPSSFNPSNLTSSSAGETIVLTSPAGTWTELTRLEFGPIVNYASQNDLGDDFPDSLVIDIPGDDFPAFAGVAVPDTSPLLGFQEGANGTFTWQADPDAGTRVGIVLDNGTMTVDCSVPDTGQFTLPAAATAALGQGFVDVTGSRSAFTSVRQGDSLLYVFVDRQARR